MTSYNLDLQIRGTITALPPSVPSEAGAWITAVTPDGIVVKAKGPSVMYQLPSDKYVNLQVSYVDAKGNPAKVDGAVVWKTSDAAICAVTADATDSTKAKLNPGANLGQAQASATADADLGAGVQTLICTLDVEVVAGSAIAGTITPVGEPLPIPPAGGGIGAALAGKNK